MRIELVVIDPQVDFCEPGRPLAVKGADKDMERLAAMITRLGDKIDDIHTTLDSHHYFDVAHPVYWKNSAGQHPAPFTVISRSDVENGVWSTTFPQFAQRGLEYVRKLETNKRYPLIIWPEHCLIGSDGAKVFPVVYNAMLEWEKLPAMVDYVTKGSNPHTEHYSGLVADVPDPSDPSTSLNTNLINTIEKADIILLSGEASSHCVANTGRDLVNNFNDPNCIKKLVILEDAMSAVQGYENLADDFINEMKTRGATVTTTDKFLA